MVKRFLFSCEAEEELTKFDWVYALTPYIGIGTALLVMIIK